VVLNLSTAPIKSITKIGSFLTELLIRSQGVIVFLKLSLYV